jgi:WD40 repeat protein
MTRQPGQRFASLRAIREALQLPLPDGRSLDELRTEAIAALCLPDLEVEREWPLDLPAMTGFTIADTFDRYAFGDKDGNVSVRRLVDHTELCRLPGGGPLDAYDALRFSPDGRLLVQQCRTAGGSRSRLWKLDGTEPAVVLSLGPSAWEFSPDSRQCAVFDRPARQMRICDPETGRVLRRFPCDGVIRMRWNPRRPLLAGAISTGWRTFNVETGEVAAEVTFPGDCSWVDWHPEGRLLAANNNRTHQITIWNTHTRELALPPLEGHHNSGIIHRFNRAGDLLLSSDWSQMWRLWDVRTGKQLLTQSAGGLCLSFRPDDGLVGADTGLRRSVLLGLFRLQRGSEFRTVIHHAAARRSGYSYSLVLNSEGRLLAVRTADGVALVDVVRGEEVALLPLPGESLPLRFEPGDKAVWTYGHSGLLRWPLETDPADRNKRRVGPPQRMATGTTTGVWGSRPDLNLIAIPNYSRGALLWQRAANRKLCLAPQSDVRSCAVSPDGRWVATGSHWNFGPVSAKVWDAHTGQHVVDLPVVGSTFVGFSPDSKWLLTSGGGARIWRTGTWQEGPPLGGVTSGGFGAFSADSELLALPDTPGSVRLVRAATSKEVARLTAPEQTPFSGLCFTPDGSQLITFGTESEALHLFDLGAIRRQLRDLGLDWSDEPLPTRVEELSRTALDIRVVGAELVGQEDPQELNYEAWRLVTGPTGQRDPAKAIPLIQKAVKLLPDAPTLLNTLGVVQYRNGQYKEAAATLEKSLAAGKGQWDGFDLFFLALCHAKLGEPIKAKECFDWAVKWVEAQKSLEAQHIEDLKAFRTEAQAELRTP